MEKHQRSTSNESLLIVSVSSCGEDKIQHTEKEKWSQQYDSDEDYDSLISETREDCMFCKFKFTLLKSTRKLSGKAKNNLKNLFRTTIVKMGVIPSSAAFVSQQLDMSHLTGMIVITNKSLNSFPIKVLSAQPHLRLLDLSGNHITILPNSVGELVKLKSLFLNQNRIGTLPEELCRLEKLEFLALAYNFLQKLPRNFGTLENLRELKLSCNRFQLFPSEVFGLANLRLLDLSLNEINKIPDDFDNFQNLFVYDLNLNENNLTEITPNIAKAPNLTILRLQNNLLSINAIPEQLLAESKVVNLLLEGNKFELDALKDLDGYDAYHERKCFEETSSQTTIRKF